MDINDITGYNENFEPGSPIVKNIARSIATPPIGTVNIYQKPDVSKLEDLKQLGIFLDPKAEQAIAEQEKQKKEKQQKLELEPGLINEEIEENEELTEPPVTRSTQQTTNSIKPKNTKEIFFEDGNSKYKLVDGIAYKLDWILCNSEEYKIIRTKSQREINLSEVEIYIKGWKKVSETMD